MPVVERLRALDPPSPDVDVDEALVRVRHCARRRRRTRTALAAIVAVVVGGAGFAGTALDTDDAQLDTVGAHGPIVRYLPAEVPDGFSLAWVDPQNPVPEGSYDRVPWHDSMAHDYAFGYRSNSVELEALVYAGAEFDPRHVVISWGEQSEVLSDGVDTVVVDDPDVPTRAIVERDHASVLVLAHPIAAGGNVTAETLVAFARSMSEITEEQWEGVIATADVAGTGVSEAEETLVKGDGWTLVGFPSRASRSVTQPGLALHWEGAMGELATFFDVSTDVVQMELSAQGSQTVAWGVAPDGAAAVRFTFEEHTIETPTVPYGGLLAFAVDVGEVDDAPRRTQALDADGAVISAVVDHVKGACVEVGEPTVDVPNVVGKGLWDAVRTIESAGLTVLGTGTPPEDPIGAGVVIVAQEPPAGTRLQRGGCVGFRTATP